MAAPKGNKNATKAKPWTEALNRALARSRDPAGRNALDRIAEKLISKAENELDQFSILELTSRTDGKPVQAVEHSGSLETSRVEDVSDEYLAHIATGSGSGAIEEATGPQTAH